MIGIYRSSITKLHTEFFKIKFTRPIPVTTELLDVSLAEKLMGSGQSLSRLVEKYNFVMVEPSKYLEEFHKFVTDIINEKFNIPDLTYQTAFSKDLTESWKEKLKIEINHNKFKLNVNSISEIEIKVPLKKNSDNTVYEPIFNLATTDPRTDVQKMYMTLAIIDWKKEKELFLSTIKMPDVNVSLSRIKTRLSE